MRRTETPKPIWIEFCVVVDIPNLVKYANFGDRRLRGFWVAGGQISPSPIDFHRRPYNTLALPCERVIVWLRHCNFMRLVAVCPSAISNVLSEDTLLVLLSLILFRHVETELLADTSGKCP